MTDPRIAIVHDELVRYGGAEVVLQQMLRLWPEAHLYTLFSRSNFIRVDGRRVPINGSFLNRWPRWWRNKPAWQLPFLIHAAEQFDLSQYDLVISSTSGFAKAVITRSNVPHVCYCHTPTRYLWDDSHEVLQRLSSFKRSFFKPIQHRLRIKDYVAAKRVDHFIANSRYTSQRIGKYYHQDSSVIYPPIDTSLFTPTTEAKSEYFLTVGRLNPSKKTNQAVAVCAKLSIPLIVVGDGPERHALQELGGPVKFIKSVSRDELRSLYRGAKALIQPSIEDFGMAAAESIACGTPVIGVGQGGLLEVSDYGKYGLLYEEPLEEYLAEAIRKFGAGDREWPIADMQRHIFKFSRANFDAQMTEFVDQLL